MLRRGGLPPTVINYMRIDSKVHAIHAHTVDIYLRVDASYLDGFASEKFPPD